MKEATATASNVSSWRNWLGGALLGAVAMYLSDPVRGRRRRALLRDKLTSIAGRSGDLIDIALRDAGNRLQGWRAYADRRLLQRDVAIDDKVLEDRVRAWMGRAISHPHPVRVDASNGQVTLSGPVLAAEQAALLRCVKSVPGVAAVVDRLDVHQQADGIPSLQGAGRHRRMPDSPLQTSWPPALRAAALLGATALGYYGLSRRSTGGVLLGAIGLGLGVRAVNNRPLLPAAVPASSAMRSLDLYKTVHVEADPETVFDQWSRYDNFPRFMSNVTEVRDLGQGRSHWIISGPAGSRLEWDAILTESARPWVLAWESESDTEIAHAGAIHLEPADTGTRVSVQLSYRPRAGDDSRALPSLFNGNPRRQLEEDLLRMKTFIESRGMAPAAAAERQPGQTLH